MSKKAPHSNFEVEDFHTYYVGESSVLVHNMCAKKADIKQVEDAAKKLKMNPKQRREFGDYIEYLKRVSAMIRTFLLVNY